MAQQLVLMIVQAAMYSAFAAGLTLIFGVLDIVNLAHGALYMWGAFIAWVVLVKLGLGIVPALLLSLALTGLLAVLIDLSAFKPLRERGAPGLMALISSLAIGALLVQASQAIFGAEILRFPSQVIPKQPIVIGPVAISPVQILTVVLGGVSVLGLWLLVNRTGLGLAIRAIEENQAVAELMGIPVDRTITITFFIAGAMAAASGISVGLSFVAISPFMGSTMELKAFAIIILGGMGSIPGAIVGAVAIAAIESLTVITGLSMFKEVSVFALVIVLLLTRPRGIFGRERRSV
ncbi:MAG: branched-chain amino acid ABC transporter permease [Ardenticatenaceae bacterium]|nr:branched-chain amino acid ABC transporter permease [Ardenticatenaceae bacterium]HBY93167.1 branched-chain amino acid ABC transporter permease [Chloroflexota bacterium]